MKDPFERIRELEELLANALLVIDRLSRRVAELEALVNQNSGNSSKPPSSDMGRKHKPKVEPSGRKRGAQPGHKGKSRQIRPAEEVDVMVDVDPEQCLMCGEALESAPRLDKVIRQYCETPAFKAFIHQINLWIKACPKCGHKNQAKAPAGTPSGAFGPNLQAKTALLSGRFRLTKREIVVLHKAFHGVDMSLGSVHACCVAASEAAAATVSALHAEIKQSPVVFADETGFGRCGKDRMWLWIAANADTEVFRLLPGRGQKQMKDLLGENFKGMIHRDRWRSYEKQMEAIHHHSRSE